MLLPILSALALASTAVPPRAAASPDDVVPILERMTAHTVDARAAAQLELGAALRRRVLRTPGVAFADELAPGAAVGDDLTGWLEGASADARRRVSIVLASDDALLGVAVRLAMSGSPSIGRIGRDALRGQLERWSVSAGDEPDVAAFDGSRQNRTFPDDVQDRAGFHVELDPNRGGGFAAFDRLDRLGGGPLPIVVDPILADQLVRRPGPPVRTARVGGTWTETLQALCLAHGASYQLMGYRFPGEARASDGEGAPFPRAWLHVTVLGGTDIAPPGRGVRRTGVDLLSSWCLDAAREGNIVRQIAAARALGTVDWPAASAWLTQRWIATGEVAALEGLLAAAARGRVAPVLQRPEVVRAVIDLVDREAREVLRMRAALDERGDAASDDERDALEARAAAADARLVRVAVGLSGLGPVALTADASPLLPHVIDGFDRATPSGRWLRLVVAEGLGLASAEASAAAVRVARGEVDGRSRRQALRTLLVTEPRNARSTLVLPNPAELFSTDVRGLGFELGLLDARVQSTSDSWAVPLIADRRTTTELIVWGALRVARGGAEEPPPTWAVRACVAAARAERDRSLVSGPGPLSRMRDAAPGVVDSEVARLIERVLEGLDDDAAARDLRVAALRAGFASPALRREALARSKDALRRRADDPEAVEAAWRDLASICADEALGAEARTTLAGSLATSLRDRSKGPAGRTMVLVEVAEEVAQGLAAARLDPEAEEFLDELRRAATEAEHALAPRLYQFDWPPRREPVPRDLERVEAVLR